MNALIWEELSPSEQKKFWESLQTNPAWVSLCQALQAQADSLQEQIIFTPVRSVEDTYMLEGKKGELRGKISCSSTAEAMYEESCVAFNETVKENKEN
jgi:hypothetical protein